MTRLLWFVLIKINAELKKIEHRVSLTKSLLPSRMFFSIKNTYVSWNVENGI